MDSRLRLPRRRLSLEEGGFMAWTLSMTRRTAATSISAGGSSSSTNERSSSLRASLRSIPRALR